MEEPGSVWERALREGEAFLGRWSDPLTRRERSDLTQDAVVVAWQNGSLSHDAKRLGAFVRTVARRLRARRLRSSARCPETWLLGVEPASPESGGADLPHVQVGRDLVPVDWLLASLQGCLGRLSRTNRRLLVGFYEGFSCSELSDRSGLSEAAVKVRLHRGRVFLRRQLENMVRAAGCFGE